MSKLTTDNDVIEALFYVFSKDDDKGNTDLVFELKNN